MSYPEFAERLSAMLDGELSTAEMAEVTSHLATCPECSRHLTELAGLRAALHEEFPKEDVPPEFQDKISALLGQAAAPPSAKIIAFPKRPIRERLAWLAASAAVAAMLITTFLPRHDETKDLMSVRDAALRGTVWQSALHATAPTASGYYLTAARTDIVAGHPAQVYAYGGGSQPITLCVWSANGEPAHGVRNAVFKGMSIAYWNDGSEEYWAATTAPAATLASFVTAIGKS